MNNDIEFTAKGENDAGLQKRAMAYQKVLAHQASGEITLRGRVLAVGGIKEKLLAAHRAGITKVLLPKECEADLEEIPQNVKEQMEFVLVEHMDEVLEHALLRNGEQ